MRKQLATVVVLILTTTGIAACGGDDDQSSGSESTDTSLLDATDGSSPDGSVPEDLSALLDRQKNAVIKVTYRRGEDEFTIAQDNDKRAITSGNTLVIVTGDSTINCTDLDTEPTCLEVPEGMNSLVNIGLSFYNVVTQGLIAAADSVAGLETSQDEVAGRDATCVDANSSTFLAGLAEQLGELDIPSASARVCIDDETGYVLEYTTEPDSSDDLVAIEVSEPSDSDFEPPVAPSELPPDVELPGDAPS